MQEQGLYRNKYWVIGEDDYLGLTLYDVEAPNTEIYLGGIEQVESLIDILSIEVMSHLVNKSRMVVKRRIDELEKELAELKASLN